MTKDKKTISDTGETEYDSAETVPDSEETVSDAELNGETLLDDGGETVPDIATVLDEAEDAVDAADVSIVKGSALLDTYRVESDAIEGGMGAVWRVHHTSWNVDLAMKRPKASLFQTEKQKENFIRECEVWINLGLHPHIVSCYYVREIGGTPTIFSEWMDGGSLKDAIEEERLYEGNAAERILDIAMQFARGLHYAHEYRDESGEPKGLIHQDVKPDNLLLTKDWEAKVADFGIAKARATLTVLDANMPTDATMFSASGGYTPAYCSMEQMNGEQLTRRTDIYSWAVSVMEMYLGERPWVNGVIAGAACEDYFPDVKVPIPEKMQALLRECLSAKETERPHDFAAVEKRLLDIYREESGYEYPRPVTNAAADTADSLNNRALSFLDLGKPQEAKRCWERAQVIDPGNLEAAYNRALYLWRTGAIDDLDALERVKEIRHSDDTWKMKYYTALLHLERNDVKSARTLLSGISALETDHAGLQKASFIAKTLDRENFLVREYDEAPESSAQYILDRATPVVISEDNKFILRVRANDVIIHYTETGKCAAALTGYTKPVTGLSYFPHSTRYILASCEDGTINLWDLATRCCMRTYQAGQGAVYSIDLSRDGKSFISGGAICNGANVWIWDANSERCLASMLCDDKDIRFVCLSPDETRFLTYAGDTLKLWNAKTGQCVRTLLREKGEITSSCVSADFQTVIVGVSLNQLILIDIESGKIYQTIATKDPARGIVLSRDARRAFTFGNSDFIQIWDLPSGRCLRHLKQDTNIYALALNASDNQLLALGLAYKAYLYDVPLLPAWEVEYKLSKAEKTLERLENEARFKSALQQALRHLEADDISESLAAIREARDVKEYGNTPECTALYKKITDHCCITDVKSTRLLELSCDVALADVDPDARTAVLDCPSGIKLWDIREDKPLDFYMDFNWSDHDISYLHGTKLVIAGRRLVHVDLEKKTLFEYNIQLKENESINSIIFLPDGKRFFSLISNWMNGKDRTYLWEYCTQDPIKDPLIGHGLNNCSKLCVSPNTRYLAAVIKGCVVLVDAVTGKEISRHKLMERAQGICFTANGKYVLAGCFGTVVLLSVPDMKLQKSFDIKGPKNWIYAVSVSPNGKYILLTVMITGETLLIDFNTGQYLLTFEGASFGFSSFSTDVRYISIKSGNKVKVYRLEYDCEFPGWADWDERARPYLETFLSLYPNWTNEDFGGLVAELQNRGYGWLRPEGVRAELENMAIKEVLPQKKGLLGRMNK